jgi:hypothetical protein
MSRKQMPPCETCPFWNEGAHAKDDGFCRLHKVRTSPEGRCADHPRWEGKPRRPMPSLRTSLSNGRAGNG